MIRNRPLPPLPPKPPLLPPPPLPLPPPPLPMPKVPPLPPAPTEMVNWSPAATEIKRRAYPPPQPSISHPATIPKGTYPNQDASVSTVSSKFLLVASPSVPPRVIEQILNIIATHIPDLIARHPLASEFDLKKRPTVADGMSIDLHPGAETF